MKMNRASWCCYRLRPISSRFTLLTGIVGHAGEFLFRTGCAHRRKSRLKRKDSIESKQRNAQRSAAECMFSARFLLGSVQCPRGALYAANLPQDAAFLLENPSANKNE